MRRERERIADQIRSVRRGFLDQSWGINRKKAEDRYYPLPNLDAHSGHS